MSLLKQLLLTASVHDAESCEEKVCDEETSPALDYYLLCFPAELVLQLRRD